jgi:hypothetical protein
MKTLGFVDTPTLVIRQSAQPIRAIRMSLILNPLEGVLPWLFVPALYQRRYSEIAIN